MATTTLKIWTIEGRDYDGCKEITTVEVHPVEDEFCVIRTVNGTEIDYVECETLGAAGQTADQWVIDARTEYRERERERRRERREALLAAADDLDLDRDDAAAVKLLARVIGMGRVADALMVLSALVK